MTLPALQPIAAAGLLVTDWCPAACRHCYVSSGPDGRAWMDPADARAHLAALKRLGVPPHGVHVGGGEPFGRFRRLMAVVRAARDAGPGGLAYVETCGFWATSDRLVRDRLRALSGAGVRQVAISADPYHQEHVPPERVRRLHAVACRALGDKGVRARRWKWLAEPRDVAEMGETERRDLFAAFLRRYPERMTGRAARELAALVPRTPTEAVPREPCCQPLLESRHVHVDPGGWVYPGTCAGIALGRATRRRPLDQVLATWRPEASPVVTALASGGPRALAEAAESQGFRPDPAGYADRCHLCWSVRAWMVRTGAGGEELKPEAIYEVRRARSAGTDANQADAAPAASRTSGKISNR